MNEHPVKAYLLATMSAMYRKPELSAYPEGNRETLITSQLHLPNLDGISAHRASSYISQVTPDKQVQHTPASTRP